MHECDLAAMSKIGGVQNSPERLWSNLSHEQYSKSVLIGNTFQQAIHVPDHYGAYAAQSRTDWFAERVTIRTYA
jgi:hypothetical protein